MTIGHQIGAGEANAEAAAVVVRGLYTAGVRHAVISPGSRNTPLVLAIHAAREVFGDFDVTVVVDERSAAFLGLGIARSTGLPVILSCSSGSAGAHYHPAFVEADRGGVPLIAVTADRPIELHERGAPQTVNQQRMLEPHVRASVNLAVPPIANAVEAARGAISAIAQSISGSNRGPVHLNMQCREPLWPHDWSAEQFVELLKRSEAPVRPARSSTDGFLTTLPSVLDELSETVRGVILAGPIELARFRDAGALTEYRSAILGAAERLGWPILADPASQLRIRETSEQTLVDNYDLLLRSATFRETMAPDAVLAFGDWPTSKLLGQYLSSHRPVLRSFPVSPGLRDPWDLTGSTPEAHDKTPSADVPWAQTWSAAQRAVSEVIASRNDDIWEGHVAQILGAVLDNGSDIHVGSSMPIRDLDAFMSAYDSNARVYASRGANGIDGTIATAAGEVIGTQRSLVAWMGDLTFLHDAGSLAWIPSDIPLTILVTDNGGGGIFHHLPIAANDAVFEKYFLTAPNVDVESVARGYGWDVETVSDDSSLKRTLVESTHSSRRIIIAQIQRAANLKIHREVWRDVAARVDALFVATPLQEGVNA